MPSASDELRAKFPGDDQEALAALDANFITRRDRMIVPKIIGYKPTEREDDAIDYLFCEWDYGYDPSGKW